MKTDSGIYYNPAYEGVRSYIAEGVAEIVRNYDVDGVQFDDYFYPTQDASFDKAAYEAYTAASKKAGDARPVLGRLAQGQYQRLGILGVSKNQGRKSGSGFWEFHLRETCPMTRKWERMLPLGVRPKAIWIISAPQMYVNFENDALPFTSTLETWKSLIQEDSIELYVGLAAYKAGSDVDDGTWKNADDILARQVSAGRELDCSGFLFYSWDYLDTQQTQAEWKMS